MKKFTTWLNNTSIQKKFFPLQIFIIISVISISLFSFFSVVIVNNSSEKIINENVRHKEQLSAIIRNMYVCRVLGRDILLQENKEIRQQLYDNYLIGFKNLDTKMENFSKFLKGAQLTEFQRIIKEKDVYKDSMILSADIWMADGSYADALYALQVVTPIANEFFGSIDDFSNEEERLLNVALENNDELVYKILLSGLVINLLLIFAVVLSIKFFSKHMSSSLIKLEKAMSAIAETGNMKIEIPSELYSKDEVGLIATVANKMKIMLLEYSLKDTLTGGLNTKAYHEELNELFNKEETKKDFWCVISDMNNLKLINDQLGHLEGDNAIRSSYQALESNFSKYGQTFRVGGDEFVSLLNGCTSEDIEKEISTISIRLEKLASNSKVDYSLAFGYGHFTGKTKEEYNEFFKIVDKKMYENKIACKQARLNARVVNPLAKDEA